MAYAALVSLAQTIDLFLNHDKYSNFLDAKEKITSIGEYVIFLISFLEDFPEKANRLEGQIRKVANEAEDIIEFLMWKQIQSRYEWISLSRVKFEHQLKEVTEGIGLIAGELMDDRLGYSPAAISSSRFVPTGENHSVIGLDDDLITIKGRLCGEYSSELQVIPIVGMGGIGKTTLARNAYDDPLIMEHFEIRAWFPISQHYNIQEILSCLLNSMKLFDEQMREQKKESTMEEKVYKTLKGRRYLIVLDDVWSTEAWDELRNAFPNDNNGSRIILTTRLSNVAAYANSCSAPHQMRFLDENQSWNLLKQKVFTDGQDCPPNLEFVGKEIARSCRGLPLAIVLVAGILSTGFKTRASWEKIAKNVNSVVDGQLEEILSLSYTHLPHHLRPCFLFIGGFPEDYQIHVPRLTKLWVAEGFLKSQDGYKSLEEKAKEYLEDLIKRNLVLVTSRGTNGNIKSCSLHDVVRELCIRKALEEEFLLHVTDRYVLPKKARNERRFSIAHSHHLNSICGPTVRTIVCFKLHDSCSSSLAFLGRFRLLRVLDVVNDIRAPLPSQVFELFHLRYLALRNPIDIPSAISKLENLQTLIIYSSSPGQLYFYSSLPLEIWKMPELKHLILFHFYQLPDPVDGSTLPLGNLQTLSSVASLICSEEIMKMIPNVKKLGLIYHGDECQEFHLHNLVHLHQLEKLKLTMYGDSSWLGQNLAFPSTLKKLTLFRGRFPWKDMNIIGSLPNLEVLKLREHACYGDTLETADGEFPQLKFLLIDKSQLRHWMTEGSPFPRLRCLVLRACEFLEEIPNDIGEIPTLELIDVSRSNKSLVDSAKQILEDQQGYGNDSLQVRGIHANQ